MQRQRVTITIDPELLLAVDGIVDGSQIRNRSHAIEHLLHEGLGLTRLRNVFFFLEESWQPAQLEALIATLEPFQIESAFLVSDAPGDLADAALVLRSLRPNLASIPTPAAFGSGGAVVLRQAALSTPFLLCWIGEGAATPSHAHEFLAFHLQHHAPLSLLIDRTAPSREPSIAIANPELVASIPAGNVDLRQSVFPELEKLGRVRAYVQRA